MTQELNKRFNKLVKDSIKKDRGAYSVIKTLESYYKELFNDDDDVFSAICDYISSQQAIHSNRPINRPDAYEKALELLRSKGFEVAK
jgi:hypothetical protein